MKHQIGFKLIFNMAVVISLVALLIKGGPAVLTYIVSSFINGQTDASQLVAVGVVNTVILLILVLREILFGNEK